jgi:mRNA interferase MazF
MPRAVNGLADCRTWTAIILQAMSSAYDTEAPSRIRPRVIAAPRIRQIYWCRLPKDAELPELWKIRPVIVISYRNLLHGHVTVIPTTTVEQLQNEWAYKLTTSFDGRHASWAICDKPMTVAVSRLETHRGRIPRISEEEMREILIRLFRWLPKVPTLETRPDMPYSSLHLRPAFFGDGVRCALRGAKHEGSPSWAPFCYLGLRSEPDA